MTTALHPSIPLPLQLQLESDSAERELAWLLHSLQDTLLSLRTGLQECIALMRPTEPGSTLVLSSPRSESLKGYVTRVGDRIVKADMQIKMYGLSFIRGTNSYRLTLLAPKAQSTGTPSSSTPSSLKPTSSTGTSNPPTSAPTPILPHQPPPLHHHNSHHASPPISPTLTHSPTLARFPPASTDRLVLTQLTHLRHHLNQALHHINHPPANLESTPNATLTHLTTLLTAIRAAKQTLVAPPQNALFPHTHSVPKHVFDPPLPQGLVVDLYVKDAAVVAELRSVETVAPPHDDGAATTSSTTAEGGVGGRLTNILFSAANPAASLWHNLSAVAAGTHASSSRPGGGGKSGGFYEEIGKIVFWKLEGYGADPGDESGHGGGGSAERERERERERGGRWVRVRDKVKVESQDPRLMAVMVKVGGLEHAIGVAMEAVEIVMGCTGGARGRNK
ncbi:Rogdi leucine zipper containing protein-domain-containing protein [Peziza echinospora]|nr:Rogdi leucine zipper containing protein-domain-containing protein [Peziza echinospora]